MKHLFFLLLGITLSFPAFSQLEKRTWLLGANGNMYWYQEKYKNPSVNYNLKYISIDLSASVGYFFAKKFAGGIRPYLFFEEGRGSLSGNTNNFKVAAGPFVRYYFLSGEKQFNLLADLGYQLGMNKVLLVEETKGRINILSAMGGIEAFFNSSVGLEFLIGYKNQIITSNNSGYNSNKKGFQASIGFHFHLEKELK